MWLDHKAPNWRDDCGHEDMQRWKSRVFSLRSRMLVFVRQVLAFVTGEVLESNWRILEAKIAKVQTVDQLLRDHVDFLDTCLKQCMLTTSKLLSVSLTGPSSGLTPRPIVADTVLGLREIDEDDSDFRIVST